MIDYILLRMMKGIHEAYSKKILEIIFRITSLFHVKSLIKMMKMHLKWDKSENWKKINKNGK